MAAPMGNQNGRKAKIWTEAIKRALARFSAANGDDLPSVDKGLDRLADRLVRAAAHGDEDAFANITEKIGDRLEGKPAQAIVGGDEDDNPVRVEGVLRLVKPSEEKP